MQVPKNIRPNSVNGHLVKLSWGSEILYKALSKNKGWNPNVQATHATLGQALMGEG